MPSVIPPNTDITFSAWLKSIDLNVKARIYDGTSNFDSTYATHATAERDSISQVLGVTISSIELIVLIEVPDLTVSKTVEIQLPMLNVGDVATGFIPSPGEMNQVIVNDLYVMGLLKANLDCNQKQLKQLRLELRTSDPGSPVRGQIWFDDATGKKVPRFNDGTNDLDLGVGLPVQATMWHDESIVTVGSAIGGIIYTGQYYNSCFYQGSPADGDTFTQDFILKNGSYTLYVLGMTFNSRGKIDWYVDDVLQFSGQDWYSSSSVYNIIKSGSITVSGNGKHTLKGVINGKNASSSGYTMTLVKMWIK